MPGILKKRLPSREELFMQELRVRGSSKRLPSDPRHLSGCLNALLRRGSIKSRSEAEWIKREIEEIAALEDIYFGCDPCYRYLTEQTINAKLIMLERSAVPKLRNHIPEVLQIQRRVLGDGLRATLKGEYSEERNILWYKKHWEALERDLKVVPCWCSYSPLRVKKIIHEESPNAILLKILAEIHDSTSETVSSLLSKRTY